MQILIKNSVEYTPSKSATDKKGAGDHNQVVPDLALSDTAEAQTPEVKATPNKTLIGPPRDSHGRRTGKNKKKQRKNKGAVTEDHEKLEVTVVTEAKPEIDLDQDKKDVSDCNQGEVNNYQFQYYDYYLTKSDDGFTKVVRKHRPRRNVSSLDKTSSNKDKTSSNSSGNRKKESTRARRKPSATNTDIKKKEKAAESSLDKTPPNNGKSSTANTGDSKKEPISTKATPRNSKRSRASRAVRSKDQSHTPSTRKTNLSTSRPASKHPSAEKHQLSGRSNSSNSVSRSNTSSTVSSISKVYFQGISRSYSSIVASTNVPSTASSSGIVLSKVAGNTLTSKIASVSSSDQVKNSTLKSSLQSSLSNQSQPEKKQEMSGRSSDVRATSEDNDVGLISQESSDMSSHSLAISSLKKKYSKSKATLVKSLIFESSILGVNKQSTHSHLEEDQDLVFSSSDDLSDVGWTSPEALGSMDSLRPQSTSSDQCMHILSLQDPSINSANNPLVCSLPGEMNSPVMNSDIDFTWNFLENQTQVSWLNRGVDGHSTHPELEKKQVISSSDERVTSEDSDPFYMSPSSLLSHSLLDEMTSTEINADIDDTPRFFEHPLYPHVFCRTPGKKKNPWMTENTPEEKGISNPFHVPTIDSPFYNSDRLRKTKMNMNTLAGSFGQADSCFNPSIVFESLQLELGDEKDLLQAVEKKVLTSLKVERATWLEKLKKVALKNIENLEELVKSAGKDNDRYRYSQVKQKIRDWTLHLELCDQGLMEVTQGGLQILTMDKIMDSLQVSSAPICLTIEEPISPLLLKRYEGVIEVIQQSFPDYSWSSIFTKLEVLKAQSGGTLNNFSTYHLNKAITNAIIQEKVHQANLATSPLDSHKSVCYTNSGQKYSHSTASQRSRCSTAGRRSSQRTTSRNDEQRPSRSRKGGQRRSRKRVGCGRLDGR